MARWAFLWATLVAGLCVAQPRLLAPDERVVSDPPAGDATRAQLETRLRLLEETAPSRAAPMICGVSIGVFGSGQLGVLALGVAALTSGNRRSGGGGLAFSLALIGSGVLGLCALLIMVGLFEALDHRERYERQAADLQQRLEQLPPVPAAAVPSVPRVEVARF